jgi:hypothetical protein
MVCEEMIDCLDAPVAAVGALFLFQFRSIENFYLQIGDVVNEKVMEY